MAVPVGPRGSGEGAGGPASPRTRAADGRAASPTWGGGAPGFPFLNSDADLSASPWRRYGQTAPRTWAAGGHQLLRPRSGGTPTALPEPRLCSEYLNSGSWRIASFSDSGGEGPRICILSLDSDCSALLELRQRAPASPTRTSESQAFLPQTRRQMFSFSKLRQECWGRGCHLKRRRLTQFQISKHKEAQSPLTGQHGGMPFVLIFPS